LTSDDNLRGVLQGVAGMCKYAWNRDGRLHLDRMAARLGQTVTVIRHALLWLRNSGRLQLVNWEQDEGLRVAPPHGTDANIDGLSPQVPGKHDDNEEELDLLREALSEVRAYRRYFLRATPEQLGLVQSGATPQSPGRAPGSSDSVA
jgi:hypothetical protein